MPNLFETLISISTKTFYCQECKINHQEQKMGITLYQKSIG